MVVLYWNLLCFKIACALNHNRLALKYALAIQKHSPEDTRVLRGMVYLLERSEIYDGALKTAEFYLKKVPRDPRILFCLSQLYMVRGRVEDSLSTLLQLDQLVRASEVRIPSSQKLMAIIHMTIYVLGREGLSIPNNAFLDYSRDPVEPNEWKMHEFYANMLYYWGRLDDSLEEFKSALALMNDSVLIYYGIGRILAERQEYAAAVDYLELATNSTTRGEFVPFARVDLAFCQCCLGRKWDMSTQLLTWKHGGMRGSYRTRLKAACLWRTRTSSRRKGELLCRSSLRELPSPELLVYLRSIESELGLKPISLEKLKVSKYFDQRELGLKG